MIRFVLRRLAAMIPTVLGINLATFVLVNLALGDPDTASLDAGPLDRETTLETGRAYGLHLPLFLNLSIEDVRARTEADMARLEDPAGRERAVRSLAVSGGAALPYLALALSRMDAPGRDAALDALSRIGARMGLTEAIAAAPDPVDFWIRYWEVYGSDFTPVRSARLVRRLVRRDDQLALAELRRLDTFCLPELFEALDASLEPAAQARLVRLAEEITGRDDPLSASDPAASRKLAVDRWREWWRQRYDMYTSFEGWRMVTGAVTETRYFRWLSRTVTLDFGVSTRDGRTIRAKLAERLPVTLLLSVMALLAAYAIAVPLGIVSAVKKGSAFDRATAVVLFVAYSLPAFWVAMVLQRYLGSMGHLDWFPAQGLASPARDGWSIWARAGDTAHHLVLPVLCLSFVSMAMLARYQRVGMLRVIETDFMRTARAKGLSSTRAIMRHGLRNGVIPVVTTLGLQLPYLVSGAVVVERVFGIPGMGFETFEAIRANDTEWLVAVVTVTAILTVLGMALADVVYALVDPRIVPGRRLGRSS